jgi:peptidoglycan hydrolase-like protein with peptidoglycan-binding domain
MYILKRGDSGGDVVAWQNILIAQGYQLSADGIFGPATESATKDYQARLEVPADGIVGDGTIAAHLSMYPNMPFAHSTTVEDQPVPGYGPKPWLLYAAIGVFAAWYLTQKD